MENVKNNLPTTTSQSQEKPKQSYSEWAKDTYNSQYESWMPWIEDQYLKWFGKGDNKASYATKDSLSKTKVTGVDEVDQVQDDVSNVVGNQIGDKGVLSPVGQFVSKEGVNRVERGGKDESGEYVHAPSGGGGGGAGGGVGDKIGQGVQGGVSSLKGVLGGN